MARVSVEVLSIEMDGDFGTVSGVCLVCSRCYHEVEVVGHSAASIRRGCVMLREECPRGEENCYHEEGGTTEQKSWRQRATEIIRQQIADCKALHPGADDAFLEAFVRENYPFGERQYYPYTAWRLAVHDVFRPGSRGKPWPASRPELPTLDPQVLVTPAGVTCIPCGDAGCFWCLPLRDKFAAEQGADYWNEWQHWLQIIAKEPEATPVFADRLEEWGWDSLAQQYRQGSL